MKRIPGLTQNAFQNFSMASPDGTGVINFALYYRPRVQCWFIDIGYLTFALHGFKITRGPNILSAYENVIPFGLCVTVKDNFEPLLLNDFSSERVNLFLLDSDDIETVNGLLAEGYTVV